MRSFLYLIFFVSLSFSVFAAKKKIVIGSKKFTESYILAEIMAQKIEKLGYTVERKFGMGGTGVLFDALSNGEIDFYPEYTGTISHAIIKRPNVTQIPGLRSFLIEEGIDLTESFGLNNSYGIALIKDKANAKGLRKISDLSNQTELKLGVSHEFLKRGDGYPALKKHYQLNFNNVTGLEHGLAYSALENGEVDIIDVYTTDAKIKKYDLRVLEDDKKFFPRYEGVALYRRDLPAKIIRTLKELEDSFDNEAMQNLNSLVELDGKSFAYAAAFFLGYELQIKKKSIGPKLIKLTKEHLVLVMVSLLISVIIGFPLGVLAAKFRGLGHVVLIVSGLLQTIPSLALLAFLIPVFGIGLYPSLVALFLYGLLPIVRGTYSGLKSLDPKLVEVGEALGLTPWEKLIKIEVPLASISILNGIKTSGIINVGTATLAALIGAGGYGTLIVTGLALNDNSIILQGAIPAACLALVVHGLFEIVDAFLIPKGLRS